MNIYESGELESTFIEIINHKKSNILVGCLYRHPDMDINEFNDIISMNYYTSFPQKKNMLSFLVILMLT